MLYPLLGLSGLFVAITAFPPALELRGETQPVHVRRVVAAGHLARRALVRAPDRRRRTGRGLRGADRRVVARVPVAIRTEHSCAFGHPQITQITQIRNYADSEHEQLTERASRRAGLW